MRYSEIEPLLRAAGTTRLAARDALDAARVAVIRAEAALAAAEKAEAALTAIAKEVYSACPTQ